MYNNKFEVYHLQREEDGHGGWLETYVFYARLWGRISTASSSERELALRENVNLTHKFFCSADASIAKGDKIRYNERDMIVLSVKNPSEANHHLEIAVEERQ